MATAPEPDDYFLGCHFKVEIDGITVADFREAEGLTVQREVVEYQEGGENSKTHKLVGQTKYSNIVLRHGVTESVDLFSWMKATVEGAKIERKNGSILALNQKGEVKMRWDFQNGWPCRYEGPRLDSLDGEVEMESLEIAHDGFEMKKN